MRNFGYFLQFLGCVVFMYFMLRPTKYYPTSGNRCDKCGEEYVGMALDCRCTNWGK